MTVQEEAKFESSIRSFAKILNGRVGEICLVVGREWVRVRPPTMEEARDFAKDFRCIKFVRVGTIAVITEETSDYVEVSCADDRVLWDRQEFKETWVPLVSQDSWRKSDQVARRQLLNSP
jgi:hypothetical protein